MLEYANSNMSAARICAESPKQKDCMSSAEIEMYIDNGWEGNIPGGAPPNMSKRSISLSVFPTHTGKKYDK